VHPVVASIARAYRMVQRRCLAFVTLGPSILEQNRETTDRLDPKWDADGLITGIVTDAGTGALLMVAHLNAHALALTQATGIAHFWSRSRQCIWKKGESSGHILTVAALRIDCDQDALWIAAHPAGPACHTGTASCFFRRIEGDSLIADSAETTCHQIATRNE
jgi:phosphoribosyl-AMP cyclohydrolase